MRTLQTHFLVIYVELDVYFFHVKGIVPKLINSADILLFIFLHFTKLSITLRNITCILVSLNLIYTGVSCTARNNNGHLTGTKY
jgi:hypothetical protein